MNFFLYLCGSLGVLRRFVNENKSARYIKNVH